MKPEVAERLFIEELFSKSVENKKVRNDKLVSIDRLTGDASTRRYYRLETNHQSYVVCLDNPSAEGEKNSFIETQNFFHHHQIRVPKIFDTQLSKGYILEEDLGNITLLSRLSEINSLEEELLLYKKAIDELIKIHKISRSDINNSSFSHLSFNQEKLNDEIAFSVKYFINIFLKNNNVEIEEIIKTEFAKINNRLSIEKMVSTHRDFHSRNIMILKDEFVVIDFQDARLGIPQYDLASLLDDCYYKIDDNNKMLLIEYYYKALGEEILGQDFNKFIDLYQAMSLQRVFKAIGSFSYIYHVRKDERYLKYIGFAMEKLKTIMLSQNQYKSLRKTLFKLYYES